MKMSIQTHEVLRLQRVALGIEAADLILSGGTVLNVYTGELLQDYCHIDYWLGLREFVAFALPRGTTTVITETTEVATGMGIEGVRTFVAKSPTYPLRIFATAPVITFLCSLRTKKPAVSVSEMLQTWRKCRKATASLT